MLAVRVEETRPPAPGQLLLVPESGQPALGQLCSSSSSSGRSRKHSMDDRAAHRFLIGDRPEERSYGTQARHRFDLQSTSIGSIHAASPRSEVVS